MARAAHKASRQPAWIVFPAEEGEETIAQEFVDRASMRDDRVSNSGKKFIQNINDVVGQAALSHSRVVP